MTTLVRPPQQVRTLMLFLLAAPLHSALGQDDARLSARLREGMQPFVDQKIVSGAVALVGDSRGVVGVTAVGLRDVENRLPMTPETIFRVMSMTKPITAVAVMMLADEKKLAIDDPVETHLPDFRGQKMVTGNRGEDQPSPRPITLRDLLTHTSGLPDALPAGFTDVPAPGGPPTLAKAVDKLAKRPLAFAPGSKWSYSNAGMNTLGRVIEVVSGMPYERFLKERLFDPLGMPDTTFYPSEEQMKRVAVVYGVKDGALVAEAASRSAPTPADRLPYPSGGLFSTAFDMAKFSQMILGRGVAGERRFLSPSAFDEMTKGQIGDLKAGFVDGMSFGLGWGVVREPSGVTSKLSAGSFGHGGALGTQLWIDPKTKTFSVLMIQRVGLPNADGTPIRAELHAIAAGLGSATK